MSEPSDAARKDSTMDDDTREYAEQALRREMRKRAPQVAPLAGMTPLGLRDSATAQGDGLWAYVAGCDTAGHCETPHEIIAMWSHAAEDYLCEECGHTVYEA